MRVNPSQNDQLWITWPTPFRQQHSTANQFESAAACENMPQVIHRHVDESVHIVNSKKSTPSHQRQRHLSVHPFYAHQDALAHCPCVSRTHGGEGRNYCCELYAVPSYQLQLPADNQHLLNILAASMLMRSVSTADYGVYVTVDIAVLAFRTRQKMLDETADYAGI